MAACRSRSRPRSTPASAPRPPTLSSTRPAQPSGPLVDARANELLGGFLRTLERRGISPETYLAASGQTPEQLRDQLHAEAALSVARELVLDAVADDLGIEVSDEEIEAALREQGETEETVREVMGSPLRDSIREDLRLRAALDRVAAEVKPIRRARAAREKRGRRGRRRRLKRQRYGPQGGRKPNESTDTDGDRADVARRARSTSTRACSTSGSSFSARRSTTRSRTSSSRSSSTSSPMDPDKDISIYINSPGGIVYAGLAIYDTIQFIKPDVQTTASAWRCRWAPSCSRAERAGKRQALPHSKILIHQGSAGFSGQPTEIEIQAKR